MPIMPNSEIEEGDRVRTRSTGQSGRIEAVHRGTARVWMTALGEQRDIPVDQLELAVER